jgi:S1-C subfamily serine protease
MLSQRNIDFKRNRIVRVVVTFNNTNISYGTGFFVLSNGLLLTCGHVVLGKDFRYVQQDQEFINARGVDNIEKAMNYHTTLTNNVKIELENGTLMDAILYKINPDYDVALLRVNGSSFSHPYFRIERTMEPYLGEEISFYGFPDVLGHTYQNSPFVVNTSIISTFPTTTIGGGNYKHMQINATAIGGISGAPLFKGDNNTVVGIINGNYHWAFNNIVSRVQNNDTIWSTKVPLGIGYATSIKVINENTDIFSNQELN